MKTLTFLTTALTLAMSLTGCNSELTVADRGRIAGTWHGSADYYLRPPRARTARSAVSLVFDSTGVVAATVGKATISNATVIRNRGAIERFFSLKTDNLVQGTLNGRVDAIDSADYSGQNITIPFSVVNDTLKGSIFVLRTWEYPYPIVPRIRLARNP